MLLEEEAPANVDKDGAGLSAADERAIIALIYRAAQLSDDRDYVKWMELFTEDGQYSAITYENFATTGLYLFKDKGRRMLHERVAWQMGLWQTPRGRTLHLVANIVVSPGEDEDTASAHSGFIMTRTGDMEHSELHACGQYRDVFERGPNGWLFKSRQVIVDSNVLPAEFTELL